MWYYASKSLKVKRNEWGKKASVIFEFHDPPYVYFTYFPILETSSRYSEREIPPK